MGDGSGAAGAGVAGVKSGRRGVGDGTDMKSYDSHVMMQYLLLMIMHCYLGGDIQTVLIELGVFFRELCCQKLKINLFERSQKDIVLILCKLEKIFPPSFFDGSSGCSSFKGNSFGQIDILLMDVSY